MLVIVLAGEAIFLLPFVVPRVFRPTLLAAFDITNLQLGAAFSLYGVVAMASYIFGGPLADRFSVRNLMFMALIVTSAGGAYLATIPSLAGLRALYAFWGMTTILLFWAALIRATREWGGDYRQGLAYGILEGGRGLVAAILAMTGTYALATLLPEDVATANREQKIEAIQRVIWIYSGMTLVAAGLVWFFVPHNRPEKHDDDVSERFTLKHMGQVLRNPAIWLQGVIVVCAYTGYKGGDNFGLYAHDVFGFDDVDSASVATMSLWIRPFTAFAAGLIADKIGASRGVLICFAALTIGDLVVALGVPDASMPWMLYTTIAGTGAMVYGLRGIYFALFPEAKVATAFTGTAVGLVSIIGYTPDVFVGPLMGYLTDTYDGELGHQYFFGVLTAFAFCGCVATIMFQRICRRRDAVETIVKPSGPS